MIANLITTLLLALGVATRSYQSESGNAFNHDYKKPIQRAVEDIPLNENKQYQLLQTYSYESTYYNVDSNKYCISNVNNTNYYNGYMSINNTQYEFIMRRKNSYTTLAILYQVYEIYNFYNSIINIDLTMQVQYTGQIGNVYSLTKSLYEYSNVDDTLVNLTLTASTQDQINNFKNQKTTEITNTTTTISDSQSTINDGITNVILQPNGKYKVLFQTIIEENSQSYTTSTFKPTNFQLTGQVSVPTSTQEIVDIPGLMFTILTLPFSFYSTAFDLTIFPNTPYALNFGNLILTILAALILLYLIRKVIK